MLIANTPDADDAAETQEIFADVEWLEPVDVDDLPALYWQALPSATGDIIATLEAASVPGSVWVESLRFAHAAYPEVAACGGSV